MNIPHLSIATVILAGGRSRRMGRDKALVPWQGVPMLQRVYDATRSLTVRSFVMSAWNDRYRDALELGGCEWLCDREPGAGPLVSLRQALDDLAERELGWVLLLACDLPSLDRARLVELCDRARACGEEKLAIVPQTERGWEPLCALYRLEARSSLADFVTMDGRSFQAWLDRRAAASEVEAVSVAPGDRGWLRNCNTPADLTDGFPGA
ncbi:MAG: molybdenum cofactor guanylyltransferase [Geitlerinemataceae cyanobacterium]